MAFLSPENLQKCELFPGAQSGLVAGEHIMLSFLEMAEGAVVPEHSHPEEQAGLVLEGSIRLRIGEEEKVLDAGQAYIVPPDVLHSGIVLDGPFRVLDIFGPPRDDYLSKMAGSG